MIANCKKVKRNVLLENLHPIIIDVTKDITYDYISRMRYHEDELGLIVKGHLLIEYIINKIIERKCKNPKIILLNRQNYTFSVKLQIVFSMGFLPQSIYRNIRRVNRIRNEFAHNLEPNYDKIDFKFTKYNGTSEETISLRPKLKKGFIERKYIKMLCFGTLSQLRNHYLKLFGKFPIPSHKT